MGWKRNLAKSLIYRVITIFIGFVTIYISTGDLSQAFGLSIATEGVQAINYFIFETIWSKFDEKRIREEVSKEFKEREIDLKLGLSVVIDISKEIAQTDTFNPELYNSINRFYNKVLDNKQLSEFHEEIQKSRKYFEVINKGRGFEENNIPIEKEK